MSPVEETTQPTRNILTVSELNRQARVTIEDRFRIVWLLGEMSNFARPRSGHWYFTLKDDAAQVRCAMFANRNRAVQMQPGEGQLVLIRGRVSLYEGRGEFQVIADYMEPAGEGALRQAFDQLKIKLAAEGLFDAERKQVLPDFPEHLAVITSPSGAAIRDVLSVLERRFPSLAVTVVPSLVQGAEAEAELTRALARAQTLEPDVILLTRGGGSLEDLWSFNSEALARAIVACPIPIVSAVGHEIDVTITDFVADVRAPTPSAAAELIAPDRAELIAGFRGFESHITGIAANYIEYQKLRLHNQMLSLDDPEHLLERAMQRVDDSLRRISETLRFKLSQHQNRLESLQLRMRYTGPEAQLNSMQTKASQLGARVREMMEQTLATQSARLQSSMRLLHGVSPLPTLARGYSITMNEADSVITSVEELNPGDTITTAIHDGIVTSQITSTGPPRFTATATSADEDKE